MAKWFGKIGFATQAETSPGIWTERITTREYAGDVMRYNRRLQTTDQVNDNITVTSEISIIADPFANQNVHFMRYIEFMGAKWKIDTVEPAYPRLKLTLGGLYTNG
jgi:hypothetical protein